MDLIAEKNAGLARKLQKADFERAVDSRLSTVDAKSRVIYPEELRHMADTYYGSAGHRVRLKERQIPDGQRPFNFQFRYRNKPQVSDHVSFSVLFILSVLSNSKCMNCFPCCMIISGVVHRGGRGHVDVE
jgi:hypothetical protein